MTKATELREFASLLTVASGQIQFDTDIKISGDLITTGNTINIIADTLNISDPNITLASGAANSAIADGAGITIDLGVDTDAEFKYQSNNDNWYSNKDLYIAASFSFDIATDRLTISNTTNTGGINIDGNNGRLYFNGIRALEGNTTGYLTLGEGFSTLNISPTNVDFTNATVNNVNTLAIGTSTADVSLHIGDGTANEYIILDKGTSSTSAILFRNAGNNKVKLQVNSEEELEIHTNNTKKFTFTESGAMLVEQVRHSIRPTLNLDFANSKQLDPRITFYRDSIATYYDSKGILRYANMNEPRFDHDPVTGESKGLLIEEARTNSLPETRFFSLWSDNAVSREYNAGIAPDGTYSAVKIIPDTTASSKHVSDTNTISYNTPYTFSVYVKSAGATYAFISAANTGFNSRATLIVNLNTGAVEYQSGSAEDPTIEYFVTALSSDWYRIGLTVTTDSASGAAGQFVIGPSAEAVPSGGSTSDPTGPSDPSEALLVWAPQMEVGAFATSYVPSDTRFTSRSSVATYYDETGILRTAPTNSPRYGYSSPYATEHWAIVSTLKTKIGSSEPERRATETGLILENSASNLENYSYNMDQSNHGSYVSPGGSFAVTNEVAAPDGSYTASKFVFAVGNDRIDDQHGPHNQGTYTFSMWVKGVAGEVVGMALLNDLGGNVEPYILLTGEWQRISITKTFDSQGTNIRTHGVIIRGAPGVGVYATGDDGGLGTLGTWANYVYVWGMQVESGFTNTSYIPTFGGTATRSADVASSSAYTRAAEKVEMYNIQNDWYNQDEGTFYSDSSALQTNGRVIDVNYDGQTDQAGGDTTKGSLILIHNTNTPLVVWNGSSAVVVTGPNQIDTGKMAFRYGVNDFAVTANGVAPETDTSGNVPLATQLNIGGRGSDTDTIICGHVRAIRYYDTKLTDAELQALTENN